MIWNCEEIWGQCEEILGSELILSTARMRKPLATTDASGNISRYAYDLDDRLTSVTDPVGRVPRSATMRSGGPRR